MNESTGIGHQGESLPDYIRRTNGRWKPQSFQPISYRDKGDGWMGEVFEEGNHPSSFTPSMRGRMVLSAREVMDASTHGIEYLWQTFIPKASIVILDSVAGVGKTTLAYNLAVNAAMGGGFAGLPFDGPCNVLYADLETNLNLSGNKIRLITDGNPPENLFYVRELNFINDFNWLCSEIQDKEIDLLIVDTINEAFNTKDEQDNAEANRQFAYVKSIRDRLNCAILLLGHKGKGEQSKKAYSPRGASARGAVPDLVLSLEEIDEDEVCLSKGKDRFAGGKEKLFLRKAGDDLFEAIEKTEDQSISQLIKAERMILGALEEGLSKTNEFVSRGQLSFIAKVTVEKALTNLTKTGKIERVRKGIYNKKPE